MTVIHAEEVTGLGIPAIIEKAKKIVGDGPTYLSFDIDSVDPSFAPGTGTPEVGGLTTREVLELIRGLKGINLVGGDVVEVAPQYDATTNTAHAGAQVLFEILSLMVFSPAVHRQVRLTPERKITSAAGLEAAADQPDCLQSTIASGQGNDNDTLTRRLKAAFAAALMLGAATGIAQCRRARRHTKSAGQINVGIFSDFPPFSSASADMSIKGYDVDVAQQIADGLGVKLNLVSRHRPEPHSLSQRQARRHPDERRLLQGTRRGDRLRRRLRTLLHRRHRSGCARRLPARTTLPTRRIAVNRGTLEDTSLTEAAPSTADDPALRQLQCRDPGVHLRPDPADGRRQRRRRAGAGPPGSA